MQRVIRIPTRVHTRKLDRNVARERMKKAGIRHMIIVELEDSVMQFKDCDFRLNKETGCFEVYHISGIRCYRTVVGMFPKAAVIGVYYKESEE